MIFLSFDPPEADKCLLAYGELEVGCSMFNVHLSTNIVSYEVSVLSDQVPMFPDT